jgi:hypothetical protein
MFSGGAMKGIAYIGALKALDELHKSGVIDLNIKKIYAVSIGSMFAFLYALGYTYTELQNEVICKDFNNLKNIKFDETTKKVTLLTKKINLVPLNIDFNSLNNYKEKCTFKTIELEKKLTKYDNNSIDNLSNCLDGKFHKWNFKNNDLICSLCNKSYDEILKTNNTTSSENNSNEYLDKLKNINLNKLSKKYCITGENHEIDNSGKCIKCKVDINTYKPTDKDLKQLEKNIQIKTDNLLLEQINNVKEHNKNNIKKINDIKEIISNLNKEYEKLTNLKLENYINTFIDKLKILR